MKAGPGPLISSDPRSSGQDIALALQGFTPGYNEGGLYG